MTYRVNLSNLTLTMLANNTTGMPTNHELIASSVSSHHNNTNRTLRDISARMQGVENSRW